MKNKKALSVIVSTLLLLLIAVAAGITLYFWFLNFQDDWQLKAQHHQNVGPIEILKVENYLGSHSLVHVRNKGKSTHILNKILLNNITCQGLSTGVIKEVGIIRTNCTVAINSNYNVEIFTDKGVYSKYVTVYQ